MAYSHLYSHMGYIEDNLVLKQRNLTLSNCFYSKDFKKPTFLKTC
nr:MAG TPA: hypothetical protein [Caudoviricetes sp.]